MGSRRAVRFIGLLVVCLVAAVVIAPMAFAGVGAGTAITFPTTVTVGQTGAPASIDLVNQNTAPNQADTNSVCNAGDSSPPCSNPERGIILVPACKQIAGGQCTAAGADPGVFQISSTATGRAGTTCAGVTFVTSIIDPTFGTVNFTPQPPGTRVTLPGQGSVCTIDFTFSVLKSPTGDQDPATPGTQTAQATEHTQFAGPIGPGALNNFARATSNQTTVLRAPTTIVTQASPNVSVGGQLTDTATVSGLVSPLPSGTVDFSLYADANCDATPVFTSSTRPLTLNAGQTAGTATSDPFTPTTPGTYRWRAFYSGDANNAPISGACNDANESSVVTQNTPNIVTAATATTVVGAGTLTDVATLAGLVNPVTGAGAGTVDFRLYAPGDATCTELPVFTSFGSAVTLNGSQTGGTATSPPFTPTAAGVYRWRAFYSGDANNAPVSGACNDAGENSTVSTATPSIVTTATPAATLGSAISDSATVSGLVNPLAGSTVDFRVFAPGDTTCSGAPVFSSLARPVTLNGAQTSGTATSASFTPATPGTYRWIATFNGDANNSIVAGACSDPNESSVVAGLAAPTIATTASPGISLGAGTLTDNATVSGLVNPVTGAGAGTVSFRLYGPGDTTCSSTPVFQSLNTALALNVTSTSGTATSAALTPTAAGTYRWIASYSGDANNSPVAGACADPAEAVIVATATPTIATTASASITLGGTLTDSATVSGLFNPVTGAGAGTVEFRLFDPDNATCSGTAIFASSARPLTLNGTATSGTATSAAFVPPSVGAYRWIAAYSGDANNAPVAGACNAADETANVTAAGLPTIVTTASPNTTVGGALTDSATVSGRANPVAGGNIVFRLYGPDNATCSGTAIFTSTIAYPVGGGSVTSDSFTPTQPGVYRWIATYSGDANNPLVAGVCNEASEATTVTSLRGTPTIVTTASPGIKLGGQVTDTATVNGRLNPVTGGTVTFRLYGPNDTVCSTTPVFTSTIDYPVGGGSVTSGAFTPTQPGGYRWIASYSGDANNSAVAGTCDEVSERVTVDLSATRMTPAVVVLAPIRTAGGTIIVNNNSSSSSSSAAAASGGAAAAPGSTPAAGSTPAFAAAKPSQSVLARTGDSVLARAAFAFALMALGFALRRRSVQLPEE